jgi:glycosyltransferase involved in cell wall biosynthesis
MHLLILHIAQVFGGAERTTANLLGHLDRSRIRRITLVAPSALRPYLPETYDHFVATDPYPLEGCFTTATTLRRDARVVGELLRELDPDVALGMMHYPSALVVLGARMARVRTRTVASYRGPFYEYMRYYERGFRRRLFLWAVVAGTALLADRVIVPSYGTALELRQRFFTPLKRTMTIPNGIDHEEVARLSAETPSLLAGPDCPDALRHSSLPKEEKTAKKRSPLMEESGGVQGEPLPLLCAIARLAPEKNLGLLLEAFRRVRAVQSALLIILGDGPERAALEARIAEWGLGDSVHLLGHHENVYPYLCRADVFIHTCQFEGFGYTLLEALACGAAVISTDCPYGPREILGDSEYGLLTPPDDPIALAEAILQLLTDSVSRQALAVRGLRRAHELSIQRMVDVYTSEFLKLGFS